MAETFVYIMASKKYGTLYIGATTDLIRRVYEHKTDSVDGFTHKYNVHNLVYYEIWDNLLSAFEREKNMKEWKRQWKIKLIERNNPDWKDLYETLLG